MIGGHALYGGRLEDHLLPGAGLDGLLRSLAIGLIISAGAGMIAYWQMLFPHRNR